MPRERAGELAIRLGIESGVAALPLQDHAGVLRAGIASLDAARLERLGRELGAVVLAGRLERVHEDSRVGLGRGEARVNVGLDLRDDLLS